MKKMPRVWLWIIICCMESSAIDRWMGSGLWLMCGRVSSTIMLLVRTLCLYQICYLPPSSYYNIFFVVFVLLFAHRGGIGARFLASCSYSLSLWPMGFLAGAVLVDSIPPGLALILGRGTGFHVRMFLRARSKFREEIILLGF